MRWVALAVGMKVAGCWACACAFHISDDVIGAASYGGTPEVLCIWHPRPAHVPRSIGFIASLPA